VLWCLHSRDLFAPALARVGLHPDRVIYCETWKDAEVLPAMEEGLRQGGLAGVVGELIKFPLTPSRRLQLAAEASGVVALVLRRSGPKADEHNASFSRWRISAAPSGPMIDCDMGRARWQLDLLRCRGAEANSWTVEACDATGRLAVPADLGDRSPETQEWRLATA
jgi:protein ImuA